MIFTSKFKGVSWSISKKKEKQEILKNLQAANSLLPSKKKKFSSSWFPVTCYGQFALPVHTVFNVCKPITGDR